MYRKLLRVGQRWQARDPNETATERAFILDETRRLFKGNKNVTSDVAVAEHLREAEARLTMAEHYRNPYPRPVNVPPKTYAPKKEARKGRSMGKAIEKKIELSKPIYVKSIDETSKKKRD